MPYFKSWHYICHGDVNVDVYETRIGRNIISRPNCRITTQAHFTPSQELVMTRVGMSLEPLCDFDTIGTEPDKEQKRLKPLEMFTWRLLCDASFQDALKEIPPSPHPRPPPPDIVELGTFLLLCSYCTEIIFEEISLKRVLHGDNRHFL